MTGWTWSDNFPTTTGAYQATDPSGDGISKAFVTKMNATGTKPVYSTYLGSNGGLSGARTAAQAIAINSAGNAYVTGFTYSDNFPVTTSAYQKTNEA